MHEVSKIFVIATMKKLFLIFTAILTCDFLVKSVVCGHAFVFLRLQALVDLHFFKEANPGQDVEAMLSSASVTFKNFIMRGLHKVGRCPKRGVVLIFGCTIRQCLKLYLVSWSHLVCRHTFPISHEPFILVRSLIQVKIQAQQQQAVSGSKQSAILPEADGEAVVNTLPYTSGERGGRG